MVCAECMKMCCLGGKNSVVKGLSFTQGQRLYQYGGSSIAKGRRGEAADLIVFKTQG